MQTQPATKGTKLRQELLADHRFLEHQLEQLLAAFEANDQAEMQPLWTNFEARLTAHLDTEDQILVPALFQWQARDARTIVEEHKHIRRRLAELGAAVDLHLVRLDVLRAFIDELRAHAQAEDKLLYQWADQHFSEAEETSISSDLAQALEARLQRHVH
jgi:hemerythrin-like domain-containing protein